MNQSIPKSKIIEVFNLLNIKYKPGNGTWMKCGCPNHVDKHPSAGININTGVIHCFTCHEAWHITQILMDNLNCSYKVAVEMLGLSVDSCKMPIAAKLGVGNLTPVVEGNTPIKSEKRFTSIQTDIYQYEYARLRGFTNEFCNTINITLAVSGFYKDYMIIPIEGNKIISYEARRVMEYEYLLKYFDVKTGGCYTELKTKYKQLQTDELIEMNNFSWYLEKPKILYPKNSGISNTLFNYNNLKCTDALYVVEGLGSVPKIYMNITKNVTATLGSELSVPQVKLLQQFEKIVLVPDKDLAGEAWVVSLNTHLTNLWVKDVAVEDTSIEYVTCVLSMKEIPASQYLIRKIFKS